jgi:hypothetical protein
MINNGYLSFIIHNSSFIIHNTTMPSYAEKLKSVPFDIGVGNAPGFKTKIRVAMMEELLLGDLLPAPASDKHEITTDIQFKTAVAASGSNPAVPAGGCIELEVTRKKQAFKTNGKHEDGYTHCDPTFECELPRTDANKAYVLKYFNGAKLFLHFTDNNGKSRVGVNVECFVDETVDDNTNGYKLMFKFGVMQLPPFYYSGTVSMRG